MLNQPPPNDQQWTSLVFRCTQRYQGFNCISSANADSIIRTNHWINYSMHERNQHLATINQLQTQLNQRTVELTNERQKNVSEVEKSRELKFQLQATEALYDISNSSKKEFESVLKKANKEIEELRSDNERKQNEIIDLQRKFGLAEAIRDENEKVAKTYQEVLSNTQKEIHAAVDNEVFNKIFPQTPADKRARDELDSEDTHENQVTMLASNHLDEDEKDNIDAYEKSESG